MLRLAASAVTRRAAPGLWPVRLAPAQFQGQLPCRTTFNGILRSKSTAAIPTTTGAVADAAAPAAEASRAAISETGLVKAGYEKAVGWWLVGTSGMLISMIAIGGYTRLSGSGLSMTDWNIQGRSLPRNDESWLREFEEYKQYPEYQRLHNGTMELQEFKRIYFVEWFHRMWGRSVGGLFAVPLAYFAMRGALQPALALRLTGLLGLGVSQAFVGWWMVRSGMDPPEKHVPTQGIHQRPRVSPYRLASHWTAALTLYVGCVWSAMDLLRPSPAVTHTTQEAIKAARSMRRLALPVACLTGLTLLSGPFVAGNDAGHAYNTWPKMLDHWVPPEWTAAVSSPLTAWRSFFEDTAVVQFDHRCLAYASATGAIAMSVYGATLPLSAGAASAVSVLPIAIVGQMSLGIATLLLYVPIELGVAHQGGGVAVLTTLLYVLHTLRTPAVLAAGAAAAAVAAA